MFIDKCDEFANKNEVLTTINDMSHKLFVASIQARDIYAMLKNYFYTQHSKVT